MTTDHTNSIGLDAKQLLLCAYASVLTPHSAVYCSGPITSGKYFLDWLASTGNHFADIDGLESIARDSHAVEVIAANRLHSQRVAAEWRQIRRSVIDPAAVPHVSGWAQADWLGLWEEVIAEYASEVVFVDGWEYSYGCAHEFWFAHAKGLPAYDEHGELLTRSRGLELIKRAADEIRARGGPAGRLEKVLDALEQTAP